MTEIVLANARIVLPGEVIHGSLHLSGEAIAAVDQGGAVPSGATDCEGNFLAPGLIELHTDNLERHLQPRPAVKWPRRSAIIAHDAELAGTGITTVYDAVRVGSMVSGDRTDYAKYAREVVSLLLALRAEGALRISHFLHLRAEICSETLIEEMAEFGREDRIGLVSLMDHTPGQRQFQDVTKLRDYLTGKYALSDAEFVAHIDRLKDLQARLGEAHELAAVSEARRYGAILASHDDTTRAQVERSASHSVSLAEFPTSEEAARACQDHGIAVMMGAPNLIRGGSHSGNVAAGALAGAGLLDILSSDYVPAALLIGAVRLGEMAGDMAKGIASVTSAPARAAGLKDRGEIAAGKRADLVRFRLMDGDPVTRGVWVKGTRVA